MAKLLGKPEFSGKLGNFVYATWKGKPYVRLAPSWRRKYVPTEKQEQNQKKFKFGMLLLRDFRELLKMTLEVKKDETVTSSSMKSILNDAIVGVHPDLSVDYSKMVIARGSLPPATGATVESGESVLRYTWTNETPSDSNGYHYNHAIFIACEPVSTDLWYELNGPRRNDLSGEMAIPKNWKGVELHTWIAFRSRDFKLMANSVYLGKVIG